MECFLEKCCKVPEQHFKQEFLSTVYETRSTSYQHRSTSVQLLACMPLTPAMKINTAHGRISQLNLGNNKGIIPQNEFTRILFIQTNRSTVLSQDCSCYLQLIRFCCRKTDKITSRVCTKLVSLPGGSFQLFESIFVSSNLLADKGGNLNLCHFISFYSQLMQTSSINILSVAFIVVEKGSKGACSCCSLLGVVPKMGNTSSN